MAMLENKKHMDKGEAEAYAQYMKVHAHLIISDDKRFTDALLAINSGAKVYNSLHLICWLDALQLLTTNWQAIVKELHHHRSFTSAELRKAYLEILKMLGIAVETKLLSQKCSLSKIL